MRSLCDSVHVEASPERVWSWLMELAAHYREWHPDHLTARWVQGEPNRVGSVLEAVERLAGHRERLHFEMPGIDPPRCMEYRIRGPHSLLLPGGTFAVAAEDGGARFTADLHYRFGPLTEALFRRRTAALLEHMREEGENLKQLVEAGS